MNVIVLAPDVNSSGGIGGYTLTVLQALAELYSPQSVGLVVLIGGSGLEKARNHARVLGIGGSQLTMNSEIRFVILALWNLARFRPHTILCGHVNLSPVARLGGELLGMSYATLTYGLDVWNRLSFLTKLGLAGSRLVLTISSFTREQLIANQSVKADKLRIIRPAVSPELLGVNPNWAVLDRYHLHRLPFLLFVGRMAKVERYKGHDVAIRAFAKIKDVAPGALIVVGTGDDSSRLVGLSQELGVEDRVLFLDRVENDELAALYHSCRAFIMPCALARRDRQLIGEGFGIVFLEAAAFGKPAIAGKFGASAEAVVDGETGILVDPSSEDDVAQAMLRLLTDQGYADELGAKGKQRVEAEFSFNLFRNTLSSIINELI